MSDEKIIECECGHYPGECPECLEINIDAIAPWRELLTDWNVLHDLEKNRTLVDGL